MAVCNQRTDRDVRGRLIRSYRGPYSTCMPTPMWWVHMSMVRPRRIQNKRLCKAVLSGRNPKGLIWPLGNCKPHEYYW